MWLKLKDAAEFIGVSERTLRGMCSRREIPHKREGVSGRSKTGLYLFHVDDLKAHNESKMIPVRGQTKPKIPDRVREFPRIRLKPRRLPASALQS